MKLIYYELRKVFSLKIFVISFALLFAVNAGISWYTQSSNEYIKAVHQDKTTYNKLIDNYSKMDYEKAVAEINKEKTVSYILNDLKYLTEGNSGMPQEVVEAMLESHKSQNPDEYKKALKLLETGYDENYFTFISDISQKLEYTKTYETFIQGMEQRAENKLLFAVFNTDDGFSEKNIDNTITAFENLKNISIETGNDYFVTGATTQTATDYFIIVLILLACVGLFVVEKDKNLYKIVKTTKRGYLPTVISKLTVLFILTFVVSIIFALNSIITCGIYSGFCDISRSIQSIILFMNCPFRLTIFQYLALWVLSKAFAMSAVAGIFGMVFILWKNNAVIYISSVVLLTLEYILYVTIPSSSSVNHLKYINVFAFIWDNNTIGNYLNLNFFGTPVTLFSVFIIVTIICIFVFYGISIFLYVKNVSIGCGIFTGIMSHKINSISSKYFNTAGLFKNEFRKYFFKGVTFALLFSLVLFCYSQYTKSIEIKYFDPVDSCYAGYMNKLSGELTKEKEQFLKDEQKYFNDIKKEIQKINANKKLTAEEKNSKVNVLTLTTKSKEEAFNRVTEQYNTAVGISNKYNIKPYFIDWEKSRQLLSDKDRDWQFFAFNIVVLIILLSSIFTYEYKNGFITVLRSTRNGQSKLVVYKALIAFITTTVTFLMIYLPYFLNYIKTYGSKTLDIPIVYVDGFENIGREITIFQYLVAISVLRYVAIIGIMMLVLAASVILKNNVITMVVTTILTIIPCVIFINSEIVRFSSLFASGNWIFGYVLITIIAIVLSIISFLIILKEFGGLKRRIKYGVSTQQYQQNI